jgi:hypothetical protein
VHENQFLPQAMKNLRNSQRLSEPIRLQFTPDRIVGILDERGFGSKKLQLFKKDRFDNPENTTGTVQFQFASHDHGITRPFRTSNIFRSICLTVAIAEVLSITNTNRNHSRANTKAGVKSSNLIRFAPRSNRCQGAELFRCGSKGKFLDW